MRKVIAGGLLLAGMVIISGEPARADEGYQKTVAEARNEIREGQRTAEYVVYFCGPKLSPDPTSTFNTRVQAGMGGHLSQRYPGSQMNCNSHTGVFRDRGGYDYHLIDGQINRTVIPPAGGLTWEANMIRKGREVVAVVYVGTDTSGNSIRLIIDIDNARESRFLDARLPISLQSGRVATGDKSLNITGNELIWALNEVYRTVAAPGGDMMFSVANSLFLNPDYREWFVNTAVELLEKNKGGQR